MKNDLEAMNDNPLGLVSSQRIEIKLDEEIKTPVDYIYVGEGGDIIFMMDDGIILPFLNMMSSGVIEPTYYFSPRRVRKVLSECVIYGMNYRTTASNMIGIFYT